jgi:LysM repeat protein
VDRVCPLLGLQADRRTAIDGVDSAHRCHAEPVAIPLERQLQARLCLTDTYERCERYRAHVARRGGVRPGRSGLGDGLVSTRMVLAPEPAWRGIAGQARRARSGSVALIGAGAAVAAGIGGIALASGLMDGFRDPGATAELAITATERPSTTASPSVRPTASEAPTPAATVVPAPVPSAVPTAAVTPAPTVAPPPPTQQTYTVQQGDTLAAIAQQFGTTVDALQAANGIEDPNEIVIGQVLVIP